MIYDLSRWVDSHPEYVLIASSDHGGQLYYGQDYFCTHGCNYEGNQGMLYVYMKEFNSTFSPSSPPSAPIDILSYDVSLLIASVLQNVNVPLKSAAKVVPLVNDPAYLLLQYRSKEVQLKSYLGSLGSSQDLYSFHVYKALANHTTLPQIQQLPLIDLQ